MPGGAPAVGPHRAAQRAHSGVMTDAPAGDGPEQRTGAHAIERAIALVSCFSADTPELSLTELARGTGLRVSTAHRIATALVRGGLLARPANSERYQLGPRLLLLGQAAMARYGLQAAQPVLQALGDATGEAVSLGLRDGTDVVVALRVESVQPLRFDRPAGARVPLHASAMGKCLVAFAADQPEAAVGALGELEAYTARTLGPGAFMKELATIRRKGYAVNDQERHDGVRAVGAPVLDRGGVARAAVAIQGPANRLTLKRIAELAPEVVAAAHRVAEVVPLERL